MRFGSRILLKEILQMSNAVVCVRFIVWRIIGEGHNRRSGHGMVGRRLVDPGKVSSGIHNAVRVDERRTASINSLLVLLAQSENTFLGARMHNANILVRWTGWGGAISFDRLCWRAQ